MANDVQPEDWIIEADISQMQALMEAGTVTSEELVGVYLERIRAFR